MKNHINGPKLVGKSRHLKSFNKEFEKRSIIWICFSQKSKSLAYNSYLLNNTGMAFSLLIRRKYKPFEKEDKSIFGLIEVLFSIKQFPSAE